MSLEITEGWTERIIYQLTVDGAIKNLAGLTVSLLALDRHGQPISLAGTVGIVDAESGKVYFDPADSDLVAASSPWSIRWRLADEGGRHADFPRKLPEKWIIRES